MSFYSAVATHLFGGVITKDIDFDKDFSLDQRYAYLNFNSYTNSFIYMFHLLI